MAKTKSSEVVTEGRALVALPQFGVACGHLIAVGGDLDDATFQGLIADGSVDPHPDSVAAAKAAAPAAQE